MKDFKNRRSSYQTEHVEFLKPIETLDENEETVVRWELKETLWCRVFPLKLEKELHYYVIFEGRDMDWLKDIKALRWNEKKLDILSSMRWNTRSGVWIDILTRERNG